MKKMKIYKAVLAILVLSLCFACKKYDDYALDFDYTTVYFSYQKPVRTIIADGDMTFQFGTVLTGVRENKETREVIYKVDSNLLDTVPGASAFTLLPQDYYTLSDTGKMVINAGDIFGKITVTLDQEKFTSDPLSTANTYALPVKILSASNIDSILTDTTDIAESKYYSIIVVKYMSQYGGTYLNSGAVEKLDGGNVDTTTYYTVESWDTDVKTTSTIDVNTIQTSGVSDGFSGSLQLEVTDTDAVNVDYVGTALTNFNGSGQYDNSEKAFYLNYSFTSSGTDYNVYDTLVLRQNPEYDLNKVELW